MKHPYEDIIHLPHPTSKKHPRMSIHDRAAQFAPFAALRGYDTAIQNAGKQVIQKPELDEDSLMRLQQKQFILIEYQEQHPLIEVTYFQQGPSSQSGCYLTVQGHFKRVDEYKQELVLTDHTVIPLDDILAIDGEIFKSIL
ncbi:hypothetical protein [Negativibacillus massiliensis]|uniref:hypothetical protein n=1 Tax=Negativibacillus massiliensis TaxID=1871035 RepID=UPI002A7FC008|nr:hypothetical protein [Negativibacillus massiliensis]MDY4046683.1 hypothetical protein [Negativibacillus massiliensis]